MSKINFPADFNKSLLEEEYEVGKRDTVQIQDFREVLKEHIQKGQELAAMLEAYEKSPESFTDYDARKVFISKYHDWKENDVSHHNFVFGKCMVDGYDTPLMLNNAKIRNSIEWEIHSSISEFNTLLEQPYLLHQFERFYDFKSGGHDMGVAIIPFATVEAAMAFIRDDYCIGKYGYEEQGQVGIVSLEQDNDGVAIMQENLNGGFEGSEQFLLTDSDGNIIKLSCDEICSDRDFRDYCILQDCLEDKRTEELEKDFLEHPEDWETVGCKEEDDKSLGE